MANYRLVLTSEDIAELLLLLSMASYDMDTAAAQSHDTEELDALKEQKAIIRKWQKKLSELQADAESRAEGTKQRRTQGAKDGWDIRRGKRGSNG